MATNLTPDTSTDLRQYPKSIPSYSLDTINYAKFMQARGVNFSLKTADLVLELTKEWLFEGLDLPKNNP